MKALAVSMGIPRKAVVLEKYAANTYQNAEYTVQLMRRFGWRSALVVSSPYHMRRTSLVYHASAPDFQFIFTPIPYSHFFGDSSVVRVRHIQAILHEYLGIIDYYLKGYLHR